MKITATGYTFDASAKTISSVSGLGSIEQVFLITNTTDNIIIYNFADPTKGGSVSGGTLTLDYDTTSMDDTDDLQIIYDNFTAPSSDNALGDIGGKIGSTSETVAGSDTATAGLNGLTKRGLQHLTTIIGHVDSVETTLGSIESTSGDIATNIGPINETVAGSDTATAGLNALLKRGLQHLTTITGHLDGVEGLLDTIDADTGNISTKIDILAGAVTSSKVQVDVITSALPSGAATSANQTTIIGHVDGIETLLTTIAGDTTDIETAVELLDDTVAVLGTDTYTEAASKGLIIGAVRRDADTTLVNTTNEFGPLQMDANGRLKVEVFSGETLPVSLASTTVTGTVAVTQSGTWDEVGINDSGNSITVDAPVGTPAFVRLSDGSAAITTLPVSLASVPSHAVTNAGTFAVQIDGNALTALQLIDDTIFTDDAAFTPGTSKVGAIGLQADEASTDSIDEGDIGAPRMTLDRKQIVTAQPHTSGGWDVFNASSSDGSTALTNTDQQVKATAGQVGGWYIFNPNTATAYVIFYNATAANVTVGTTNPKFILPIPAGAAANLEITNGIAFDTAITVAATTTGAGNTAPTIALDVMVMYK